MPLLNATLNLTFPRPRRPSKDKTCPNSSDIEIARDFLFHKFDADRYFTLSYYCERLENVVDWMQVKSSILWRRI